GQHLGQRSILGLDPCRLTHEPLERPPRIVPSQGLERELAEALEALEGERFDQLVLRREVPVHGADAHAGPPRDLLHLGVKPVARHALARRLDHALAVSTSVGTPFTLWDWLWDWDCCSHRASG